MSFNSISNPCFKNTSLISADDKSIVSSHTTANKAKAVGRGMAKQQQKHETVKETIQNTALDNRKLTSVFDQMVKG